MTYAFVLLWKVAWAASAAEAGGNAASAKAFHDVVVLLRDTANQYQKQPNCQVTQMLCEMHAIFMQRNFRVGSIRCYPCRPNLRVLLQ